MQIELSYDAASKQSHPEQLCWRFFCCSVWFLQAWTTACSNTLRPLRRRKWGETSCCESPTRSWRIWECPELATRSWYWRLWTYSVLWWVHASHKPLLSGEVPLSQLVKHLNASWIHQQCQKYTFFDQNKAALTYSSVVTTQRENSLGFNFQTPQQIY